MRNNFSPAKTIDDSAAVNYGTIDYITQRDRNTSTALTKPLKQSLRLTQRANSVEVLKQASQGGFTEAIACFSTEVADDQKEE